jgi:hypothetical protein
MSFAVRALPLERELGLVSCDISGDPLVESFRKYRYAPEKRRVDYRHRMLVNLLATVVVFNGCRKLMVDTIINPAAIMTRSPATSQ